MDSNFMGRTSLVLLLVVSLSSVLIVANGAPSTRPLHVVSRGGLKSNLIAKFCEKTTNPALCAETIQPHFPDIHDFLDPLKALAVEVDASLHQAKKIASVIGELLAKQDMSGSLKDSLKTCRTQYSSILDSIKETKDAIARHDVIDAKFKFSAVLSFQATCKDEFEGIVNPFATDSDAMFQLGGNCLDIIADMEKANPQQPAPVVQSPPSAFSNIIGTIS